MSRRAGWLVMLGVLVLHAEPASAQRSERDAAVVRARIDSLKTEYDLALARREAAREEARRRQRAQWGTLDTTRIGAVTIVTAEGSSRVARRIVADAVGRYEHVLAGAQTPLDTTLLLVEYAPGVAAFEEMQRLPGHTRVWIPRWRPEAWRRRVVERFIGLTLAEGLPPKLGLWLGAEGVWVPDEERLERAYRALASSPSPAADACRVGSIGRCGDALGLSEPGPHWERWYTTEQLIGWTQTLGLAIGDGARRRCGPAAALASCVEFLRSRYPPPAPLDHAVRATLLAHAVELGGPGAYGRLRNGGDAEPMTLLSGAAGVPADSLISSWRTSVLAARREAAAGLGGSWLVTLFWVVVLAGLSMRSTRWRLG